MRYCMYCGMPMEDDDLFCTRCGKAVSDNKEKAASGKAENPELLADDATITGTMRTVTSEAVPGAGAAAGAGAAYGAGAAAGADAVYGAGAAAGAGAAYGAGRRPAAGSPHRARPENPAYNRPETDSAAYGPGPAAAGGASNAGDSGSDPRPRRGGRRKPGRDSMYGDPHVDTAIEKSKRRSKTDPGRYIMLVSAAVLVLVLGFLLFLLVKPVDTDEKKEKDTVAYEDDSKKEENLSQGLQTPASGQAQQSGQSSDSGNMETPSPAGAENNSDSQEQADVSAAGDASQNSGQSAQAPQNSDQSAQTPQNNNQSAQAPQNNDQSAQAPQNSGQSSQPQYEEPEDDGYEDDGYEDDDSNVSGWEVDEDGNEVYYAGADEQNTDNDQTSVGGDARNDSSGVATQSSDKKKTVSDKTVSAKNDSDKTVSEKSVSDKVQKGDSDYILPESSSRYYTKQELSQLDDYTLQMAINEIYARHGRKFDTQSIREYFEGKTWYRGTINPADFDGNEAAYFNEYEMANRELMSQIRADRQGTTVQ